MIKIKSKLKKTLLIISLVIVVFVVLVIAFISPISKYLIEKYDVKIIGREVKCGLVYVNPFTGYIHIGNLRLYEQKSDSIFISVKGLSVNLAMWKLIKKDYVIESLTLNGTEMNVVQTRDKFNFNDIIDKFTPKEKKLVKKARTKLSILNISIENSIVHYREKVIPIDYYIKDLNVESPGMRWNVDTMYIKFNFKNGPAPGAIKGDFTINLNTKEYRLWANVQKFDLRLLEQYLHDMANYGSFRANLDLDAHVRGNLSNKIAMNAKGWVAINDFHFGKTPGDDFLSFDKFLLSFKEVNPREYRYYLDSGIIYHPVFKYEVYDYLDNLQRMFGEGGSKIKDANADSTKFNLIIEIAKFVQDIGKNFMESYFKIDRVAMYNSDIKFNDYSPREKFALSLNPLTITADSIDRNKERFKAVLNSAIKPYGSLAARMSVDPNDYQYFDATYSLQKVSIPMLNPYIITYTSFPLDRGSLEFNGDMHVVGGQMNSHNHLLILDPRVGPRLKKKDDTKWIPVPLIMAFVRERGDVIDYDIPVTGNLKNPKIHFKDIVFDLLKNIFVKPPTTPYAFKIKKVENEVEKSLMLVWETRQVTLRNNQEKFMDKMTKFMKDTPNASITIYPMIYTEKEKEYILFYEAKKKYYLLSHKSYTADDSAMVEEMSPKDSGFVHYLNAHYNDSDLFTIQQKCTKFVGENIVDARYNQLEEARKQVFLQSFKENGTDARIKMAAAQTTVPFNGFSYYQVKYNGEIPQELTDAYNKLDDMNEDKPRRKYLIKRKNDEPTRPIPVPGKK